MGCTLFWVKFGHAFAYFVVSVTSQMALFSNINFYFDCKTRLCLIVPGREFFAQENFYLQCILDDIHMNRTHLFLTVNTNTWRKAELHLINLESCTIWLPIGFHVFTSRIDSKGYHSLVPGLISFFLQTVWVPLNK